jgi:EPS-associated MarR family transcriptional regulator
LKILRLLNADPSLSQRALCRSVGISLGAVNYCLHALIERGFVKVESFSRSSKKGAFLYILTPSGIVEKTVLTSQFINLKKAEYDALRADIDSLSTELSVASRPDA